MVIGLVSWAMSIGLLIIAVVVLAVRYSELSDKISKCKIGSLYMQMF